MGAVSTAIQGSPSAAGLARLSTGEKLSYASGEVASNLAWTMAGGFLLLYYTDVALLPVAALGTLMLVTRVLDAIFDPAVGLLVDRTRSRFGKARPYLLYAAIPFGVLMVATFSVPAGLSPNAKLIYAYLTFTALGLFYSLLYIPYSALLPMMTRDPDEKVQLGSYRSVGTSIATIFVYSLTLPIVGLFGSEKSQLGFTVAACAMGGISAVLYLLVFVNCRERLTHDQAEKPPSATKSLAQVVRNRTWWIVFSFVLLIFIRLGATVSSVAFFAKDVLGSSALISILLTMFSVAHLLGGFLAKYVLRRVSKRIGNYAAIGSSILIILVLPFVQDNHALFVAIFTLAYIGGGIQGATVFILMADAVEEHDRRFDSGAEGLIVSSVSFGMKVGGAIGAAATGYVLGWAGYNPEHATATANTALTLLFYGVPVGIMLTQLVCISFLNEQRGTAQQGATRT